MRVPRPPAEFDLELPADPTLGRIVALVQTVTVWSLGLWALEWAHATGLLLNPVVASAAAAWFVAGLVSGVWALRRAATSAPVWRVGWSGGQWWWHRVEGQSPEVHTGRLIPRVDLAGWLLIEARRERGGSNWMLGRIADRRLRVALNWA